MQRLAAGPRTGARRIDSVQVLARGTPTRCLGGCLLSCAGADGGGSRSGIPRHAESLSCEESRRGRGRC